MNGGSGALGGGLHPGAKVAAVLLAALGVVAARSPLGLVATGVLAAGAMARVPGAWAGFLTLVRRLRWVFLFILLLHGWFTPGEPVAGSGPWGPSVAGLARGGELVGVVVLMAALVAALVRSTPPMRLAAGVAWLLAPLGWLGLPVARFGRLLAWTVDRVEPVRAEAGRVRDALRLRVPREAGLTGRLRLEAWTARAVLRRAREAADRNAEALYLRRAGQVPPLGGPDAVDLALVVGAAVWAGLVVWGPAGGSD
jgi:energy-coupling factor transport system permease protein